MLLCCFPYSAKMVSWFENDASYDRNLSPMTLIGNQNGIRMKLENNNFTCILSKFKSFPSPLFNFGQNAPKIIL